MTRTVEFEIALSFAGEDRVYVDQVANLLRSGIWDAGGLTQLAAAEQDDTLFGGPPAPRDA